jgi:colanic acid/amylovoran biosynthesis glycosyltransferase
MNVLHSCHTWLRPSENWIHTQISNLPDTFHCEAVCRELNQPDAFVVSKLHSVENTITSRETLRQLSSVPLATPAVRWAGRARERLALSRLLHSQRINVLHSHFGPTGWSDAASAALLDIPHVVTFYGIDVVKLPRRQPSWKVRYRKLFREVAMVLCEGEHMASEIVKLGCPTEKVRVHRLGINLESFELSPRRRSDNEPFRVLMAARFREKKGFVYGIEALGRLKAEFDLAITIIGDGTQEERAKINEAIAKAGLAERARVLGFLPHAEMVAQAQRHHIFLAPSVIASDGDTEGGAPVVIIDMMGTGMPVVATRHCDIPNVVIDGTTGFLAPERDASALSVALRQAFQAEKQWPTMGRLARERVETEFNSRIQGGRLGSLYLEAAQRRSDHLASRLVLATKLFG